MSDITQILTRIENGDPSASDELLPLVYQQLRRFASRRLAAERPGQTLQATALVHEAYLRLVDSEDPLHWKSRGHFFGAAAQAMRRILVERSRRKRTHKRGGGWERVELTVQAVDESSSPLDILALDEALTKLAARHPRMARLIELRFFSGLTMEQAAVVLGVSVTTANRDWTYARAWLHRELLPQQAPMDRDPPDR